MLIHDEQLTYVTGARYGREKSEEEPGTGPRCIPIAGPKGALVVSLRGLPVVVPVMSTLCTYIVINLTRSQNTDPFERLCLAPRSVLNNSLSEQENAQAFQASLRHAALTSIECNAPPVCGSYLTLVTHDFTHQAVIRLPPFPCLIRY